MPKRRSSVSTEGVAKRARSSAPAVDLLSPVSALSAMSDDSVTDTDMSEADHIPPADSVLFHGAVGPTSADSSITTTSHSAPTAAPAAAPAETISATLAAELFGDQVPVVAADADAASGTASAAPAVGPAPTANESEDAGHAAPAATVPDATQFSASPHVAEAAAVRLLAELGIEPGALVSANISDLSALIDTLTKGAGVRLSQKAPDSGPVTAANTAAITPASVAVPEPIPQASVPVVATVPAEDRAEATRKLGEVHISADRVVEWTVPEMKRVATIERWTDTTRNVYALGEGPQDKDWGKPAPFNDTSNVLCIADTSIPLTFWLTGEIAAQWWFDVEGLPASRPALSIQPMGSKTAELAKDMLNEFCMPPGSSQVAEQFGPDQVKASRWMNTRATKGQPAKTHEFKAVYDARKSLKDKTLLQQLNVAQLKIHDIVVMEVNIGRYPVKEDGAGDSKGKRRAMERWQSFYDLQAIYKIKDATSPRAAAMVGPAFEI